MNEEWAQIEASIAAAERLRFAARRHARAMAKLLVGNLREQDIDGSVLAQLKRELRDFNIQTHRWTPK